MAKRADGCREDTIRNLRARGGLLSTYFAEKLVSDILPPHIAEVLSRGGIDHTTKDNDRRAFSSFFSWCMEQGYCTANPARKTKRSRHNADDVEPKILNVEQVRNLLETAEKFKGGKVVPYIALGLFTAIRPTELARLRWENIDLEAGTVTIGPKMAKMRSRRLIEMVGLTETDDKGKKTKLPANLIEWLAPHAIGKTPIKDANWRKDFDALRGAAGLIQRVKVKGKEREQILDTGWAQDVLRHTGISHHFAFYQHEGKTATWAGNSPTMIHRHYKGLVKPNEPAEFFSIKPREAAVKFNAAMK